jgi:hypothetical protein
VESLPYFKAFPADFERAMRRADVPPEDRGDLYRLIFFAWSDSGLQWDDEGAMHRYAREMGWQWRRFSRTLEHYKNLCEPSSEHRLPVFLLQNLRRALPEVPPKNAKVSAKFESSLPEVSPKFESGLPEVSPKFDAQNPPNPNKHGDAPDKSESESESKPESKKKREKAKPSQPADLRSQSPAIQACRKLIDRYPHISLWDGLISVLGDFPDLEKLASCRKEWLMRGYNPLSLKWVTDWYVNGIPASGGFNGAANGNHKTHAIPGGNRGGDVGESQFRAKRQI